MSDLFPFTQDAKAEPPIWREGEKLWMLTRYADVQTLLRAADAEVIEFQAHIQTIAVKAGRNYDCLVGLLSAILFFRNPPWQKQARASLRRGLAAIGSRMSDAEIEPIIDTAVASVAGTAFTDAVPTLANRIPILVMAHLFGLSEATVETLNRQGKGVVNAWKRAMPLRVYSALEDQAAEIDQALRFEIHRARQDGGPLSAFLDEMHGYDDREIVGLTFGLIMAGIETTSGLLSSVLYVMAAEPQHVTAMRNGELTERGFVDEVLRMAPPLRRPSARRLAEDQQFGDVTLPAGSFVSVDIMSAQRDPALFENPHGFDPSRSSTSLLAFGNGIHACLGVHLASLEGRLLLRAALNFELGLPNADGVDWDPDPTFCRLRRLDLQLNPIQHRLPS
ncbi:cytochrome P450 [Corticibacterium sp. UT-5YL-CI-8]|nr:cytochrome P450 [Tianweitania sp. UT-5YL-CI-8]